MCASGNPAALIFHGIALVACFRTVEGASLRRTQCAIITDCEGPGYVYSAGLQNGHDRFDFFKTPTQIYDSKVEYATFGLTYAVYVNYYRAKFTGFFTNRYEVETVKGVRRAHATINFVYYEMVNGSWLIADYIDLRPRIVEELEGLDVRQVATGSSQVLFVLNNGSVLMTGNNGIVRVPMEDAISASVGGSASYIVLKNGTVWARGTNDRGQVGVNSSAYAVTSFTKIPPEYFSNDPVVAASAGNKHVIFLTSSGDAYGAGNNKGLGRGYTHYPRRLKVKNVKQVQAAHEVSAFVLCNGTVLVTGSNDFGQLGVGDREDRLWEYVQVPGLSDVICAPRLGYMMPRTTYLKRR